MTANSSAILKKCYRFYIIPSCPKQLMQKYDFQLNAYIKKTLKMQIAPLFMRKTIDFPPKDINK